jgi:hypothetical protein
MTAIGGLPAADEGSVSPECRLHDCFGKLQSLTKRNMGSSETAIETSRILPRNDQLTAKRVTCSIIEQKLILEFTIVVLETRCM